MLLEVAAGGLHGIGVEVGVGVGAVVTGMGVMEAVGCRGASVGTVFVPHPTRKLIERTRQNININRFADSLAGCCL
jgi:hypothetical protein